MCMSNGHIHSLHKNLRHVFFCGTSAKVGVTTIISECWEMEGAKQHMTDFI